MMGLPSWGRTVLVGIGVGLMMGATAAAQPATDLATRRRPGIDVQDYDFTLSLSDTTDRIEGRATVRLRVTTDTLTAVRLDLIGRHPAEAIDSSRVTGMQVLGVSENGSPVPYRHDRNLLRITPSTGFSAGQTRTFRIHYAGVPADGLIIGTNRYGNRTFFGDNWPHRARHWLPVVDHLADKATVEFRVRAPARYEVVSNGVLVADSTTGERRVTHWRTDVPLPPKVAVIGVADFSVDTAATVDGVPVQSWVYPENEKVGFKDLGQAPPILRFFEDKLGPYPYDKLANVQSTTRYGGMENASAIFYSEEAVADGEDSTPLLAHEIAHQWFGNTATEMDWPHLWLSEGFATYLTGLYLEHAEGTSRFREYMKEARQTVVQFHDKNPSRPVVDTTYADPTELLNPNSYQKGAWVLHMLRQNLGTETFWEGLRTYYDRYRHKNARTRDFRAVMEDVSGQELGWFFDQWTRRAGHPVIDGTWVYDEASGTCIVTVRQTQDIPPFRVPLEVKVTGASPSLTTINLRGRKQRTRINCSSPPSSITLDPNTWLLAELSITRAG